MARIRREDLSLERLVLTREEGGLNLKLMQQLGEAMKLHPNSSANSSAFFNTRSRQLFQFWGICSRSELCIRQLRVASAPYLTLLHCKKSAIIH
jgi:hypothetical protein